MRDVCNDITESVNLSRSVKSKDCNPHDETV